MKNKLLVILSAIFLLGAFLFGARFYAEQKKEKLAFLSEKNVELFLRGYAPTLGSKNPSVYLVEFLDPECESCRAFHPHVKEILSDYKEQVQLVVRYAPFHRNSAYAVKVLEASRKQGKYWDALEILFTYQPQWASHHDPRPELIWTYLPEAGVDVEQAKSDMYDPEIEGILQQDIADGKRLGVRKTPSFFVNGTPLEKFGPGPLRDLIKSELKKAED